MRRELGIARCGLACCLCTEKCDGCGSGQCPDKAWCENRKCSIERGVKGCFDCAEFDNGCKKGMLGKIKPYTFTAYVRKNDVDALLDRLESNEKSGVVYHREGYNGDYDYFDEPDELIRFIETGKK